MEQKNLATNLYNQNIHVCILVYYWSEALLKGNQFFYVIKITPNLKGHQFQLAKQSIIWKVVVT